MKLPNYYPFRSVKSRAFYLSSYAKRDAQYWPLLSKQIMVGTSFGETFVRVNGMHQSTPVVLLPGWNVSSLTNATNLFYNCDAFDQNLSSWDIDQISIMNDFMRNALGLSTSNYDALLVGWEATLQAAYPSGAGYPHTISVHFGGSQFTLGGAGETAKNSLVANFGWTIQDGGGI